jgi:hypothetical protein
MRGPFDAKFQVSGGSRLDGSALQGHAIRCYEKLGFKIMGRHREAKINGTRKLDVLMMDILSSEFESPVVLPTLERAANRAKPV